MNFPSPYVVGPFAVVAGSGRRHPSGLGGVRISIFYVSKMGDEKLPLCEVFD